MTFRWWILGLFLSCLAVSGLFRHRARREGGAIERRREGTVMLAGRGLVALPLFLGVVLIIAYPPAMAWAALPLPIWLRWVGLALGLLTVPLCYWVFSNLGASVSETVLTRDDHLLVTEGPYRWVRHPLYTTGLAMFLAIGLMAASGFILLMTGLAMLLILVVVIPAEEERLVETFGEDYRALRRRTGRLVPRLRL